MEQQNGVGPDKKKVRDQTAPRKGYTMTTIHRLVLSLLAGVALAGGPAFAAGDDTPLSELGVFLHKKPDAGLVEIMKVLVERTAPDRVSDYLYAPESRYGILLDDVEGDGYRDVVIAEIASTRTMLLHVLNRRDKWTPLPTVELTLPVEPRFARGVEILRLDLNGDGIRDFYPRILDGVRRAQSIDCPVIMRAGGTSAASGQCLVQDQAVEELERDGYVYAGMQPDLFQYSHIADLGGDGRHEIIVTRFFEPEGECGRACVSLWPDVYEWTPDGGYREANDKYPAFHDGFRTMLVEALQTGKAGPDMTPAYRGMIGKIDDARRR